MFLFFGSNIECIEYPSHVNYMFKAPVAHGGINLLSMEKDYIYFFINFSDFQQGFPILSYLIQLKQPMITT